MSFVYVDDFEIAAKNKADVAVFLFEIRKFWELSKMGEIDIILGMNVVATQLCKPNGGRRSPALLNIAVQHEPLYRLCDRALSFILTPAFSFCRSCPWTPGRRAKGQGGSRFILVYVNASVNLTVERWLLQNHTTKVAI